MSHSQSPRWLSNRDNLPRPRATTSFLNRVRTTPPDPSRLTQQTVSVYRLSWDRLKSEFLEKRFPKERYKDVAFNEQPRIVRTLSETAYDTR